MLLVGLVTVLVVELIVVCEEWNAALVDAFFFITSSGHLAFTDLAAEPLTVLWDVCHSWELSAIFFQGNTLLAFKDADTNRCLDLDLAVLVPR